MGSKWIKKVRRWKSVEKKENMKLKVRDGKPERRENIWKRIIKEKKPEEIPRTS